jgi:hypothetical protein
MKSLPEIAKALSWSNQISRRFRRSALPGKMIISGDGNTSQKYLE